MNKWIGLSFALGTLLVAMRAGADEDTVPQNPMLTDAFFLSAGALWAKTNTQASLNSGAVGAGALIDFENDLGLPENDVVAQFMFRWRMSKRWRLEAEYFKINREHDRQIGRNIQWGNLSIPLTADVNSTFNFADTRVSLGYSLFRTQDKEVGVALGFHVTQLEASLSTANSGSERASKSAPLPVLSVYAEVALTDRWMLGMRVDRLSLEVNDTSGSISSTGVEFVYQPWRHFNIGFGYRDLMIRASSTGGNWRGNIEVQHSGPMLFVGTTF
jgi:hypothetical protein